MEQVVIKELVKSYGDLTALKGISLSIPRGKFFSLLGPSGCGKTTTLRLIGGFEEPGSGEILINGETMNGLPPYRRPVNTVFQNYALFPHMNVFDNLAFGLVQKRISREEIRRKVQEILDLVRLPGFEKRRVGEMSGGQQQRIALARALVNQPQVLLLDEPLGSLDQKLRKKMQVELKRLQESLGVTFILVTHDQEEALALSDVMAVMNEGKIEQVGLPHEIYEFPKSRFVAEFIGATNLLEVSVLEVDPDYIFLRFGESTLRARKNGVPCRSGEKLEVSVRPERLCISRSREEAGENVLDGRITDVRFLGDVTHYEVTVTPETRVVAALQNATYGEGSLPLSEGEQIYLHCRPDALRMVKA